MTDLVAHTPAPGNDEWHMLLDHLETVATLARAFAEPFGAAALAYQLGLWHDIGKSTPGFQAYLQQCYADPSFAGRGPDHKAAGATLAQQHFPPLALLVQGHHGGLKNRTDFTTWLDERRKDRLSDGQTSAIDDAIARMRAIFTAIDPPQALPAPAHLTNPETAEFFLRMLFSTLVDADFLDTEQHRNPSKAALRGSPITMATLLERFTQNQQQLTGQAGRVNSARQSIYDACIAAADQPPGIFRLAVPTGGGKTRSAMAFALHHARQHGQQRVIVAVPYISITEQNAAVYRSIFETDPDHETPIVLEHHSGADARRTESNDYQSRDMRGRLAAENWDAPIIVTTMVQLFESLFANQTSRCRKLHRLANSVIILDEVQALPTHLLETALDGLRELTAHYGTTVVLSTATQPAFTHVRSFAEVPAYDIVPDAPRYFRDLARVHYEWRLDAPLTWDEVATELRAASQVLVVVNTKADALHVLDALDDPDALHLSTLLCGAHRRAVIAEMRDRLAHGRDCRLVSTQVIEAGVDIDFPLVLRAMGPLDRIIQAAGRCNREGRLDRGRMIVFEPAEGSLPPGSYRMGTGITHGVVKRATFDPDNPDDVGLYFERLLSAAEQDRENIQELRRQWDFPAVAKAFRLIDDESEDVIVPYGRAEEQRQVQTLIERLRQQRISSRLALRQIQPYMVSLRTNVAKRYRDAGFIEPLLPDAERMTVGIWHGRYDAIRGIVADDDRSQLVI
jgi:CRISPR-associated endonuclease/helicase Cas3